MNATWLRERRKQLNISQEELAAKLQIAGYNASASAISHWENGRYNLPLEETAFREAIVRVLKISVLDLLTLTYEISEDEQSTEAKRAAFIIEQLPHDQRLLALGILEQFIKANYAIQAG